MKSMRCLAVLALAFLVFLTVPSWAKNKPTDYQDAVLQSFKTVSDGPACAACFTGTHIEYTVLLGDRVLTIQPKHPIHVNLVGQTPGSHILVSVDGGQCIVKVGERETHYMLLGSQ